MRDLIAAAFAAPAVLALGAGAAGAEPAQPANALRPLCPDRPAKGTAPCTVDKGHWQLELDAADLTHDFEDGASTDVWLVSPMVKLGVADRMDVEASLAPWTRVSTRSAYGAPKQVRTGVGDLYARAKLKLSGAADSPNGLAVEPFVKIPTAREGVGNRAWEGGVLAPAALDLPRGWSLGLAPEADVVRDASGEGHHLAIQLPVGLGHDIGPLAGTVELWMQDDFDPGGETRQYSLDLAAAWQPRSHPDLQLDGGVNFGLNKAAPDLQLYVGLSRRF